MSTGTLPTMFMNTDVLTLAQWLSPAFPVGAFAFSHGVETAVREGRIDDADGLQNWLKDLFAHGSTRSDIVLLAAAYRGEPEVDAVSRAFQPSAERLEEARQLGAAFARTVRDVWGLDVPDLLFCANSLSSASFWHSSSSSCENMHASNGVSE